MSKKFVPIIILFALFVQSSCAAPASPERTYATQMQAAVKLLPGWEDNFVELDRLLTEELDSTTGVTRLDLIELYNIAMEYQISRDDYAALGLSALDALVPPSVSISKDGSEIRDILSAAVPVQEMQADHQILLECVEARIAFTDELSSSIKKLSAIDVEKAAGLIACDSFQASLEKLTDFVSAHQ